MSISIVHDSPLIEQCGAHAPRRRHGQGLADLVSCEMTVTAAKRIVKFLLRRGWKVTERADGASLP